MTIHTYKIYGTYEIDGTRFNPYVVIEAADTDIAISYAKDEMESKLTTKVRITEVWRGTKDKTGWELLRNLNLARG